MPEKNTAVARPLRQSPRVSQVDLHDLRLQGRPRVRVDDELRRDFALIDFFVLCYGYYVTRARLRDVKKIQILCRENFFVTSSFSNRFLRMQINLKVSGRFVILNALSSNLFLEFSSLKIRKIFDYDNFVN